MRLANKLQSRYVLILGDTELQTGKYQLKRMIDGHQIEVDEDEILTSLRNPLVG
jgi:histidyl-tRNA synthetase